MQFIIHDLEPGEFAKLFPEIPEDTVLLDKSKSIHPCLGCFGCWVKTPATCVIKDDFNRLGTLYSKCEQAVIISKCVYGCYSPFVKNVLDRSINYILPFFTKRNGEMHHPCRYDHQFSFNVHFYGDDIQPAEKATAEKLVRANAVNMDSSAVSVRFYENAAALKGAVL